ncbi:MAG: hypothetical protein Q4E39_00910 [bacterium]|nr:hypothetical protein [bacterium]
MPFQTKKPPIRIVVDIDTFNNLCELLTRASNTDNEEISIQAKKIREKILQYSVPHTDENGETNIDIRYFNNEITQLIYILLCNVEHYSEYEMNYYEKLLITRENLKRND